MSNNPINSIDMTTADNIVGKWSRTESIRNIRIKEEYQFFNNGLCLFTLTDNCDGLEEHTFCYEIDSDLLYLIEHVDSDVLSHPITIDNNTLTVTERGITKQYTREK